ncbi:hypothetical protein G9A89_011227 [Geosiphon pyriformis]|nr:hypothetical protein G9A89_011227 [Geosiphon pyriformis]
MDLLFNLTAEIITCIILQRTSTNRHHPKVAESENIGANHLRFVKSLFQYYSFNFYVNEKIFSLLGTSINTESARETFYRELIQNTNLSTNHNFVSIITEINKEIEHHTQQRYLITYANKGKEKLQTPVIYIYYRLAYQKGTTTKINLATKLRKKLKTNFSVHYTKDFIKTFRYNIFRTSSTEIAFEHQRTSTNKHYPKVVESENIEANHLGFAKFLFQHYCQYLGLNHNYISAESAFNFYINKKIFSLLKTPVNTESARKTFYRKLIQNTSLSTNHNFTSIITEINKEIEHYTQQKYPITYVSKDKGKLQTPAVTPRKIQPPTWKKNKIESPSNPSYHYTSRSAINISSTDTFPSTAILAFRQFPFQSRQKKTELLGPYGKYFKGFNLQSSTPSELQSLPSPPDFGIFDLWKQNLNLENSEIETPNYQRQNNPNSKLIHHEPIQPSQVPPQQLLPLQQLQQQPPQQLQQSILPMAYAPITKLEKFTGEEDDAQAWLNDVAKAIITNN